MDAIVSDTDQLLHDSALASRDAALRLDLGALLAGAARSGIPAQVLAGVPAPSTLESSEDLQAAIVQFWQAVLHERPDPLTPLWIGAAVPFGRYPLLDHLGRASETIEHRLVQLARYYRLVSPKLELHVGPCEIVLEPKWGGIEQRRVIASYTTGIVLARLQTALGEPLAPRAVELVAAPGSSELARLGEWLGGAACTFGHPVARIALRPETWNRPLPERQPVLARLLEHYADERLRQRRLIEDPTAEIRAAIQAEQETGPITLAGVARRLGMNQRTLQRRLRDCAVTFRQLLGEQRREWAKSLLAQRKLAIGEVAYALGYSEQTAFARAFRRWTGISPHEYRRSSA